MYDKEKVGLIRAIVLSAFESIDDEREITADYWRATADAVLAVCGYQGELEVRGNE